MFTFLKSLFRHYKLSTLGAILGANVLCLIPFLASFIGPLALASQPGWGQLVLIGGFGITGQVLAVSGRLLDRRFRGARPAKGGLGSAWAEAWAEGLVVAALLLGLFSLAFNSVPFYWAQGTAFGVFSLVMLAMGTSLVLAGLPYYLPIRRREGLGLLASAKRAFRLMNERPGLTAAALGLGALAVLANLGTLGLFPGLAGLAALHQGVYDAAVEPRKG